jgi:uncharacterized protein (TIGR02301 family)
MTDRARPPLPGLVLAAAIALAGPAGAAPAVRTGEQRQALLDLAYVLGQAHALHRVCAGPADDTWRGRMERLLETEAPPEALKASLTESFNAGYSAEDGRARDCKAAAGLEAEVARRGRELARRLSGAAP